MSRNRLIDLQIIKCKTKPIYRRVFDNTYPMRSRRCKSISDRANYYNYNTVDGRSFWHRIVSDTLDTQEHIDTIVADGLCDEDDWCLTNDPLIRAMTAVKRKQNKTQKEHENMLMHIS